MAMELLTSLETYEALHMLADGRKAVVKVERQALLNLLLDHWQMLTELKKHGVQTSAPPPKRRRETLIA